MKAITNLVLGPVLVLVLDLGLAGCGGGGDAPQTTGRATFTVIWPANGRLIPAAANSIKVEIKQGASVFTSKTLARPVGGGSASAVFDALPLGSLTAIATAFPQADGTGNAQAKASVPLSITAGQNTAFSVTMATTIDHLEVGPANPTVLVGQNGQVNVTAKDTAGNVVLTAPSKVHWTSANAALATVDDTGKTTGVAPTGATPGPVQLTVTESESGKTAAVNIAVTSITTIAISPTSATLPVGDPKSFTSTVTNATNSNVTWAVQEGAAGGTVSTSGAYTAPATPGTYHVVATSVYDNSQKATATVTVQSGNANVTIN